MTKFLSINLSGNLSAHFYNIFLKSTRNVTKKHIKKISDLLANFVSLNWTFFLNNLTYNCQMSTYVLYIKNYRKIEDYMNSNFLHKFIHIIFLIFKKDSAEKVLRTYCDFLLYPTSSEIGDSVYMRFT